MIPKEIIKVTLRGLHSSREFGLDILLGQAPTASASRQQKLEWLRQLVNWIRADRLSTKTVRLRMVIQVLNRNPELMDNVSSTLRSIIRETRSLELFMNVGIPSQHGFVGECFDRLSQIFLPQHLEHHDLISVFSHTLRQNRDARWILEMDNKLFQECMSLFHDPASTSSRLNSTQEDSNRLIKDIRDSLFLISHSIRAVGLSRIVRNRVTESDFRKLPFYLLTERVETLIHASDGKAQLQAYWGLNQDLQDCTQTIDEVFAFIRIHGVSIALVYQMERLKALLKRLGTLARLLTSYKQDPRFVQGFIGLLVKENIRSRSLRALLKDNMTLVCQKIIETNAEAGEHYITRSSSEQWQILKRSGGGGLITAFTNFFKLLLHHVSVSPFLSGFLAVSNYSVSFIGIQLCGFTLATKQPAATAAALTSTISNHHDSANALAEESIHLIRSQLTAVAGNIAMVVPTVILIEWVLSKGGWHLTDMAHAEQTIQSFSLLGMTPFFAAFTGVLLWLSSVFAGWLDNWYQFRRLSPAIETHPRLTYALGKKGSGHLAAFMRKNIAGFAASVSLGFFLGMTQPLATFFGLPLEVRHVTLSSAALVSSVLTIGPSAFESLPFWLAVGGILSMAVLNLGVSFSLALAVALWAKRTAAPNWRIVFRSVIKRLLRQPSLLFYSSAFPSDYSSGSRPTPGVKPVPTGLASTFQSSGTPLLRGRPSSLRG